MTKINWVETVPSASSTVGSFPQYAKSVWTAITTGMAVEHYWDGTGGASQASRGDLLPGASRAFYGAGSASSSSGTGKLFFDSTTSRLYGYGSAGTYLLGTPYFSDESIDSIKDQSGITTVPSFTTAFRLRQSQTSTMAGTTVTFPIPYLAPPLVWAQSSQTSFMACVSLVSESGFACFFSTLTFSTNNAAVPFTWEAIGWVSSASF